MDRLPAGVRTAREQRIRFSFGGGDLAQQLAIAREPLGRELASRDRGRDGASRLALVTAVAETTVLRKRGDVCERDLDAAVIFEQAELAHARRVDQNAAFGQLNELARGRRV